MAEYFNTISHREYVTRLAWIEGNLERPSRSDYYIMQLTAEVRDLLSKSRRRTALEKLKLTFSQKETKKQSVTDTTKVSQDRWTGMMGMQVVEKVRTIPLPPVVKSKRDHVPFHKKGLV